MYGDVASTWRAIIMLNRGRPARSGVCIVPNAARTVPINLVMAEKLPRLRLKTHPATAIFSQHLRITRNCRSFVPFHLYRRSVPGNPRAVHCLTPRTPRTPCPCHERERKRDKDRERRYRDNRHVESKINVKSWPHGSFILRRSRIVRSREEKHARSGTSVHLAFGSSVSNHGTLKFPRDYRRPLSMLDRGPVGYITILFLAIRHGKSSKRRTSIYVVSKLRSNSLSKHRRLRYSKSFAIASRIISNDSRKREQFRFVTRRTRWRGMRDQYLVFELKATSVFRHCFLSAL